MKQDPFGNLTDWGTVLDIFEKLADAGRLAECQPGLIRILRFKGNWRLREEVLKRVGEIQAPSKDLFHQVLYVFADDNIYYDARVIAGNALIAMLKNVQEEASYDNRAIAVKKITAKLKRTPQPPFFGEAVDSIYDAIAIPSMLEN